MSTKTLRKRIALVAVSALGAGLLSAVSVSTANATYGTNASFAADKLQLATAASTTGSAVATGTWASLTSATFKSVGLLAHNDGTGTTQTATMLNTGSLVFYTGDSATTGIGFVADGGTFSGADSAVTTNLYTNASRTIVANDGAATTGTAVVFSPNSGATTATVNAYKNDSASLTYANFKLDPSQGTLVGSIAITIVSTSKAGIVSPADSYMIASATTALTSSTSSPATKVDNATSAANADTMTIAYTLNDAYGADVSPNVVTATATNGAIINWGSAPGSSSTGTAVRTSTTSNGVLYIKQGVANKAVATTVTIVADGVTVGSKTLTFTGDAASIKAYDALISDPGSPTGINIATGSNYRPGVKYKVYDEAGNWIADPSYGVTYDSADLGAVVSGVTLNASASLTDDTAGYVTWTCPAAGLKGGSADITLYTYNAANVKISTKFTARCAGDLDTFKVSTDKTTYAPGDIISVTISGMDVKGDPSNDRTYVSTSASKITVVSSAFTTADGTSGVAVPGTTDATTDGKITYKYVATQTEGTYTIAVSVPLNASGQGTVAVPVTIKSTSSSVTNAEVLAAIVKLIASINKQITALQKLLTKKK